jgi:hypothetical protein
MTQQPSGYADAKLAPLPEPTPAWRTGHDVHFYDDDAHLLAAVSQFSVEGIQAGQPMIIIATKAHRRSIQERLQPLDRETLDTADITWLDARETLTAFMEGDLPNEGLFLDTIGNVFERVLAKRNYLVVRAYGEMVDLLWNAGNVEGAIAVEQLWNDIAAKYSFNLLCAYSMGSSLRQSHNEAFERICKHHGSVLTLPVMDQRAAS